MAEKLSLKSSLQQKQGKKHTQNLSHCKSAHHRNPTSDLKQQNTQPGPRQQKKLRKKKLRKKKLRKRTSLPLPPPRHLLSSRPRCVRLVSMMMTMTTSCQALFRSARLVLRLPLSISVSPTRQISRRNRTNQPRPTSIKPMSPHLLPRPLPTKMMGTTMVSIRPRTWDPMPTTVHWKKVIAHC